MRNKELCKKCKYKGGTETNVFCDYSGKTGKTVLRREAKGKVINLRGDDPDKCLLFEPDDGEDHNPLKRLWREDKV